MYKTDNETKRELFHRLIIIFIAVGVLLFIGTMVYHFAEGWSIAESLYYSTVSLTSRGISDKVPTHWFTMLFSVLYLIIGVAVMLTALSSLVGYYTAFYQKGVENKVKGLVKQWKSKRKKPDKWIVLKPSERPIL